MAEKTPGPYEAKDPEDARRPLEQDQAAASADSTPPPAPAAAAGAPQQETTASVPGTTPERRPRRQRNKVLGFVKEVTVIVAAAVVLSFLIKTFLFRAFFVPSESMVPTLEVDDRIFVNRLVPSVMELKRGDVVVFRDTKGWLGPAPEKDAGPFGWVSETMTFLGLAPDESKQYLVKRVIGLPGDHVRCCDAQGHLMVNDTSLQESYINPAETPDPSKFDVTVPAGKIWVMGDNRNHSADSRAHVNGPGHGFVDIADVEGRTAMIVLPLNRLGGVSDYPEVFSKVPPAGNGG